MPIPSQITILPPSILSTSWTTLFSKKWAKPKYISRIRGTSITACPSDIQIPDQGDRKLLASVTANIGPGIITPDNEMTTTLSRTGNISGNINTRKKYSSYYITSSLFPLFKTLESAMSINYTCY
jgi:hypothetical protein